MSPKAIEKWNKLKLLVENLICTRFSGEIRIHFYCGGITKVEETRAREL